MAKLVVCLYNPRDEHLFYELERHLMFLERAGEAVIWHPGHLRPGQHRQMEIGLRLEEADVILFLISADFLALPEAQQWVSLALRRQRRDLAVVIPVLLRPALLIGPLDGLQPLPKDGRAVTSWPDRDEAWTSVAEGVYRVLRFAAPDERVGRQDSGPALAPPTEIFPLHRIFSWTGLPPLTYVEPEQMEEIRNHLLRPREGLVIEGPSGIGKTTALNKALEALEPPRVYRLSGTHPTKNPRAALQKLLDDGFTSTGGHLIVDDFHRVDRDTQHEIANLMKFVSDEGPDQAKVTLIGVNPVGETLLRDEPDLTGRYARVFMGKQGDDKIAELIRAGERAAHIEFARRDQFVELAGGSFFIAQLLCYQAAFGEGLRETQPTLRVIDAGPDGPTLDHVLQRLSGRFHDPLITFATCDDRSPPRGAGLVLLWLLSREADSRVSLERARALYPQLGPVFEWMVQSHLSQRFRDFPRLREILYYNRDQFSLSAEDPRLAFYLRNMAWEAFLRDTRHRKEELRFDPVDGPLLAPFGSQPSEVLTPPEVLLPLPPSVLLHLSDLHFHDRRQAAQWFDQLAEDFHNELGVRKLDAVILSGDITDRARPEGYQAAQQFLADLKQEYSLAPEQIVIAPGNHDMDRRIAKQAYDLLPREARVETIQDAEVIDEGGSEIWVRNELRYRQRFAAFANFYREVRPEAYPLEEEHQFTLHHFPVQRLLILGLNSAWEVDHHHVSRASIHSVALGRALRQVRSTSAYQDCLKVAVWHHPIQSAGDDRIRDTGFLERLAKAGFRIGLHGHIHEAQPGLFRNDRSFAGRRVDLLGAGTFGAAGADRPPGIPLQYQLLRLAGHSLRVETRRREKDTGTWKPDARWEQGAGKAPLPHYDISLWP